MPKARLLTADQVREVVADALGADHPFLDALVAFLASPAGQALLAALLSLLVKQQQMEAEEAML